MNQKLIRPYSTDGIQLPGLLYTPDIPTNKNCDSYSWNEWKLL